MARRGQALLVAILALTLLTASAIALASAARVELRVAKRGVDQVRRDAALRGGVERGIALVEQARSDPETLLGLLRQYNGLDWKPFLEDAPPEEPPLQLALQIIDASSRLNLNSADQDQLSKLPGIDRDSPAAIGAWRDEQNETEDTIYGSRPRPYESKKRPFDTLEELLLVRDVDTSLFFGVPTVTHSQRLQAPPLCELLTAFSGEDNADAAGEPRADVNTASEQDLLAAANRVTQTLQAQQVTSFVLQRDQRVRQGNPFRSVVEALQSTQLDQSLWGALMDGWTVDRRKFLPGRVNVNTAPAAVLLCLPGMTREIVTTLLERRTQEPAGLDWQAVLDAIGAGTQQNGAALIFAASPLPALPGPQPGQQQQQQQQQGQGDAGQLERVLCVRSNAFLVRCLVRDFGSRRTDAAMAVVYVPASGEAARVVQWRQPDRFPGWTAWLRQPGESEGLDRGR